MASSRGRDRRARVTRPPILKDNTLWLKSLVACTTDKNRFHILMYCIAFLCSQLMLGANVLATLIIGDDKASAFWDTARRTIVLDNLCVTSLLDPMQNRVIYEQFLQLIFGQSFLFCHGQCIINTLSNVMPVRDFASGRCSWKACYGC